MQALMFPRRVQLHTSYTVENVSSNDRKFPILIQSFVFS